MDKDIAIEVKNLSKDFVLPHKDRKSLKSFFLNPFTRVKNEKQHALDDVSFEVKKGEFFGIVGRNGSGKSTLLKCIAGVYHPSKGHIKINGSLVPFIELGVGFNPELSGRENVYLNGSLLGFSRKEMDSMYDEIVEFAELGKFMDQKLKNYSSGMQVRLAFSIAIRARGDILLLDEVLAVGDKAFQQKCYEYFEGLKGSDKTVIFVSHDMAAVKRFCSKAIFLSEGRVAGKGAPSEVADEYIEANVSTPPPSKNQDDQHEYSGHKIKTRIKSRTKDKLLFEISYQTDSKEPLFIGISVLTNGVSIAEISTEKHDIPLENGRIAYTLDTSVFNSGIYTITGALFKFKNRELIAITKKNDQFVIKEEDISKAGPLKLDDTWEIQKA